MPFEDKVALLRSLLSEIDIQGKCVLDAGSGRSSARAILERRPKEATLVCAPEDDRKAKDAQEELTRFPGVSGRVLQVDLSDASCFQEACFDFILADYLVSGLQWGRQFQVVSNLYRWLRREGQLFLVDIEPPNHSTEERWIASALLFWTQFLVAYSQRVVVEPTYYPQQSVNRWLEAVGFQEIQVQWYEKRFDRTWALQCYERAIRLLSRIENEALRSGVQQELGALKARVESLKNFASPGIVWTSNYVIRAKK